MLVFVLLLGLIAFYDVGVMARSLWEASGHWHSFGENMFTSKTADDQTFVVKPMNCPGHIQVFKSDLRSYRELPLRLAEFGNRAKARTDDGTDLALQSSAACNAVLTMDTIVFLITFSAGAFAMRRPQRHGTGRLGNRWLGGDPRLPSNMADRCE